jgi:hypothetical protein
VTGFLTLALLTFLVLHGWGPKLKLTRRSKLTVHSTLRLYLYTMKHDRILDTRIDPDKYIHVAIVGNLIVLLTIA